MAQIKMTTWSEGRVALLGDAAPCAAPTSGAGHEPRPHRRLRPRPRTRAGPAAIRPDPPDTRRNECGRTWSATSNSMPGGVKTMIPRTALAIRMGPRVQQGHADQAAGVPWPGRALPAADTFTPRDYPAELDPCCPPAPRRSHARAAQPSGEHSAPVACPCRRSVWSRTPRSVDDSRAGVNRFAGCVEALPLVVLPVRRQRRHDPWARPPPRGTPPVFSLRKVLTAAAAAAVAVTGSIAVTGPAQRPAAASTTR